MSRSDWNWWRKAAQDREKSFPQVNPTCPFDKSDTSWNTGYNDCKSTPLGLPNPFNTWDVKEMAGVTAAPPTGAVSLLTGLAQTAASAITGTTTLAPQVKVVKDAMDSAACKCASLGQEVAD